MNSLSTSVMITVMLTSVSAVAPQDDAVGSVTCPAWSSGPKAELFELGFPTLVDAEPEFQRTYRNYLGARKHRDLERLRALFGGRTSEVGTGSDAYETLLASETILEYGDTIWMHLEGGARSVYTQVRNSTDGECVVSLLKTTWNREQGQWKLNPKEPRLRQARSNTDLNLTGQPVTVRACAQPVPGHPAG